MKKMQGFAFPVILVYLWVMMILLGAIVLETFMVYPNIFHDPPRSLEIGLEFMSVRAPSDFFPPFGSLLDHRHRSPDLGLAREVGPLLDPVQLGHDRVRRPGFDGVFLAPERDHVHRRLSSSFRRIPEANGPRLPDAALVEARVQRRGFRVDLCRVPEILPTWDPVPCRGPQGLRGARARSRTEMARGRSQSH